MTISQSVEELKQVLISKNQELLNSQLSVFKHNQHNILISHFNIAIEQMAHSNIGAFILLTEKQNHLAAMAIMRMHLDCLLKMFSIFLITPQEDWIKYILYSEDDFWRKKVIIENKKVSLTDKFLCEQLEKQGKFKDALDLYKYSCDFIHPSDKHFSTAVREWLPDENGNIKWSTAINMYGITEINDDIIKSNYICMINITDFIIYFMKQSNNSNLNYIKYDLA